MRLKDFNETFKNELQDPDFVAAYLEECLADSPETFLTALQNVARANDGMTQLSRQASLGRESLYRALSEQGNPEFKTLQAALNALGLRFSIVRADAEAALPV